MGLFSHKDMKVHFIDSKIPKLNNALDALSG